MLLNINNNLIKFFSKIFITSFINLKEIFSRFNSLFKIISKIFLKFRSYLKD